MTQQAQTVPAPLAQTLSHAPSGVRTRDPISPLARAALDNGVSFADVQAYVEASRVSADEWAAPLYEALNVPCVAPATPALQAHVTEMVTDTLLEGALVRSVLAIGTVAHARLWWRGVL